MRFRRTGLWKHSNFVKLWAGQTVSLFGSQMSGVALPLTAVLILGATPLQMGLLRAAVSTPGFVFGLFAGAWVDRVHRRPVMVVADLGRALILGSIPLAAVLGVLHLEQLYAVAFFSAVLGLGFETAYRSYLPSLVAPNELVEGNSKLAVSGSAAEMAGPAMAGALVQALTAPVAIALDAFSFLVSAVSVATIDRSESIPPSEHVQTGIWTSIGEGLRVVVLHREVRAIIGSASVFNLFDAMMFSIYVLYVVRELGITPAALGLIFAIGGGGGLIGALVANRVVGRFGMGQTVTGALSLAIAGDLLIPLAGGPAVMRVGMLSVAEFVVRLGATVYGVNVTSMLQILTPARLQGRVHAADAVLGSGLGPLGALVGGFIGEMIGLRSAVIFGVVGTFLALPWLIMSPVHSWRGVDSSDTTAETE
jgi:MFS family permease